MHCEDEILYLKTVGELLVWWHTPAIREYFLHVVLWIMFFFFSNEMRFNKNK